MPLPTDHSNAGGPSGSSSSSKANGGDSVEQLIPKLQNLGRDEEADDDAEYGDDGDEVADEGAAGGAGGEDGGKKKKKKKKRKAKGKAADKAGTDDTDEILSLIRGGTAASQQGNAVETDMRKALQAMDLMKLLEAQLGGGQKALIEHKFWKTQPVPQNQEVQHTEGPIDEPKTLEEIRTEPYALPGGFEWSVIDVKDEDQMQELHMLLTENYVEDDDAMFRFRYSREFLRWALTAPGYEIDWHIGVRVQKTGKLVGFISGIKVELRCRQTTFDSAEINFLCVHKKLRSKRLAPVLIKEVTRRVNLTNVWQAIYTAGVVIPTPFSTCRYYHRNLNPPKLVDIGFSPLPRGSTIARLVKQYALGKTTQTPGFREMVREDIPQVGALLRRYLSRFDIAQTFSTDADIDHWFVSGLGHDVDGKRVEQVVWAYVVEDPTTHLITDLVSFYSLPSTVMKSKKYDAVNAAYLYYYASDVIFSPEGSAAGSDHDAKARKRLDERLNGLIRDLMIMAQTHSFDVLNALTLMDNNMFLTDQKFGPGDGYLNYYLYNWSTAPIDGGMTSTSERESSGVGVVML